MGRETFLLPVTWTDDGWPRILPPGERVPLTARTPGGAQVKPDAAAPLNGTFTWRDDYAEYKLSPQWIMLREPTETWWELDADAGVLQLTPRAERLSGNGNPSYLARRVQHAKFAASLALEPPEAPGVLAGLAVFQNERYHYFLSVRREGDQLKIELERPRRRESEVIASATIPAADRVELQVAADNAKIAFRFTAGAGEPQTLVADTDAKVLTTEVAGGFVGATIGPHVRIDE
jgi:alpha-N-arabinofuranosidase